MQCHVYKVKIQSNKLNRKQSQQLKMLFVEGKWLYNDLINSNNIFKVNTTNIKSINHYNKDKQLINSQLHLGSQLKQSIHNQIKNNIKILSILKKNGHQVGSLKHISELKSINLQQYNITYKLNKDYSKIKIQGIKGWIRVNGLDQLKDYQIANAKLLNTLNGYYIAVTTFKDKIIKDNSNKPNIGIDFGCTKSFTLSNKQKLNYSIKETERLKYLQRKLEVKKKNSNNRRKLINKIRKQYNKINNKKNDQANKFVHYLKENFNQIYIQDEQISKWQSNGHGKSIQHDILGRVKNKLKKLEQVKVIDKFIPTTKICSNCGYKQQIDLYNRIYKCPICGLQIDRDINSAMNIMNSSPMEHRSECLLNEGSC